MQLATCFLGGLGSCNATCWAFLFKASCIQGQVAQSSILHRLHWLPCYRTSHRRGCLSHSNAVRPNPNDTFHPLVVVSEKQMLFEVSVNPPHPSSMGQSRNWPRAVFTHQGCWEDGDCCFCLYLIVTSSCFNTVSCRVVGLC